MASYAPPHPAETRCRTHRAALLRHIPPGLGLQVHLISDVLSESTAGLARADVCRADEAAAFRFRVQFYEPLAQAFPPAGPSSGGVRLSIVTPDVPDAERCGHLVFGAELCTRGRVFRVHPCARAHARKHNRGAA
jgi:hypothetical protein